MPFIAIDDLEPIELSPGVRARTPYGKHLMLSYLELDKGSVVPTHSHPHEQAGHVAMSDPVLTATQNLKDHMYERVYPSPLIAVEVRKAKGVLNALVDRYTRTPEELPRFYRRIADDEGLTRAACDYVAGMTDRFALDRYRDSHLPKTWV